jgi:hypothetical protein
MPPAWATTGGYHTAVERGQQRFVKMTDSGGVRTESGTTSVKNAGDLQDRRRPEDWMQRNRFVLRGG